MSSKYFAIRSQLTNLVLDIEGGKPNPGAAVKPYNYHGGANQLWFEDPHWNVIRSKLDESLVLDATGGALAVSKFFPGVSTQQWRRASEQEGPIRSYHDPNLVLDIAEAKREEGSKIIPYTFNGGLNQMWRFERESQPEQFFAQRAPNIGFVGPNQFPGAQGAFWTQNSPATVRPMVAGSFPPGQLMSSKHFVIRSKLTNLVLDIEGGKPTPGTAVKPYNHHGRANQLWFVDPLYHVIRSKLDESLVLDVTGGALAVSKFFPGISQQQWKRSSEQEGPIRSLHDPNLVLDIAGAKREEGARIIPYTFTGGPNQMWRFEHLPRPEYFFIQTATSNLVLDVKGENRAPGAEVGLWTKKSSMMMDNQLWYEDCMGAIRSKMNGFTMDTTSGSLRLQPYDPINTQRMFAKSGSFIRNVGDPSMCLDVADVQRSTNARIISYKHHGGQNQQWKFDLHQ